MNDRSLSPPTFDFHVASPARVYDYYLHGKDNFPADRDAGDKVMDVFPGAPRLAQANRGFLLRAVKYCVEAGVDQVIDLGTGIPTSPNVAEVARAVNRDTRVIGVDNDPVVLSHQRAEAAFCGGYTIIEGDVRRPWAILADPKLNAVIDLSRPVAVLCVAVLHFIPDADEPAQILAAFTDTMAAGSFLAVSAATSTDTDPAVIAQIQDAYANATAPVIFRPADRIRSWFDRLDLVHPGLMDVTRRPSGVGVPTEVSILGGLARKPTGSPP
jgi:S-adenosyl methyltransferase